MTTWTELSDVGYSAIESLEVDGVVYTRDSDVPGFAIAADGRGIPNAVMGVIGDDEGYCVVQDSDCMPEENPTPVFRLLVARMHAENEMARRIRQAIAGT